jgi:hypothetical protein
MKRLLNKREEVEGLRLAASQPESATALLVFLDMLRERIVGAVLEEDRVRSRLEGRRFHVVAADYREDKAREDGARTPRLAEIGLYDYDEDVLVVAVVDPRRGGLLDLEERRGTRPPISDEELEEAKRLADHAGRISLRSKRVASRVVAFPTPSYRLTDERAYHRCCTLYAPSTRAGGETVEVVVDLSRRELVPEAELRPGPPSAGGTTEGR